MGHEQPDFFAFAEDADVGEALVNALSALYARPPEGAFETDSSDESPSLEEMLDRVRRHTTPRTFYFDNIPVKLSSHWVRVRLLWNTLEDQLRIWQENPGRDYEKGIYLSSGGTLLRDYSADVAPVHENCPVPVGAAIYALNSQEDLESILLRLCASPRMKTGGMSNVDITGGDQARDWYAPLEMSATYHGDHHVARDVALSWLYLHNGLWVHYKTAGLSLDELTARVEAAPKGTNIGLSRNSKLEWDHLRAPYDPSDFENLPVELWCRRPRPILPEDDLLSREQVLTILQTPSETLLGALEEVAARPDPIWLEAERGALKVIEAAKKLPDEEKVEIDVDTLEHRYFLAEHAPYHVRRLDNGRVMIATQPYRTLWPLWSEALRLLGIRR